MVSHKIDRAIAILVCSTLQNPIDLTREKKDLLAKIESNPDEITELLDNFQVTK